MLAAAPVSHVQGPHRLLLAPPMSFGSGTGVYTVSALDGGRTGWYYDWGELVGLERPHAKKVALLGMGGGEMLRAARRSLHGAELVGVELDPAIAGAASREFGLAELGVQVVVDDAKRWVLRQPNASVDVLMVDVYDSSELPEYFRSPGFYAECRRVVGAKGALMQNVWGAHLVADVARAMHRGGFPVVTWLDVGKGNHILWAGELPQLEVPAWMGLERRREM
jgi:hypothetical protein